MRNNQKSHDAPQFVWNMNVFSCLLNSVQLTSLSRRLAGKLFQIRGPAAARHLSPKRLWTRVTEHFLPEEDLGSEQNFLRRDEHRRPDSQVLCLTALGIPSWQSWIQLVVWRQPMKLTQNRCDVFATFGSCDQPCRSILDKIFAVDCTETTVESEDDKKRCGLASLANIE